MMSVRAYQKWLWLCVATSLPLLIGQGCSKEFTSTEIERNIASLKDPQVKRQQSFSLQTQALSPDQDFQARCAAPGVIRCNGFNNSADLATGVLGKADDGQIHGSIDTSVKASGTGSLRFDILSKTGPNTAGYFLTNLSADKQTFGSNKKFYFQFRQRFTQTYLSTDYGGNGWKQFILYKGTGTSGSSCTDMQLVQVSQYYSGRLHMYRSCGTPNLSIPLENGDYRLQQGDYNCLYRTAKTGDLSQCATFKADQWMTFYYEISVGQLVQETATRFRAPMSVKAWVAYEGQGYKQYIDRPDFDVTATYSTDAFGRIQITPYDTHKDSTIAHPNTATWYDDLIVSTQPIAAPGATTSSPAPAPSPTVTPAPSPTVTPSPTPTLAPSPTPTVAPVPTTSPSGVALFVDFGKASGVNTFGVSGFNTVIKDAYTNNQDLGPGGMTIVTGSNRVYNYQGVRSSTARNFSAGEKIRVTWYNNSASAVSFVPKISFTDADRIGDGVGWLSMTAVNIAAYGSAISEFTFPAAGSYSLVNVNVNYANQKIIVADKIELITSGVTAPAPTPTVAPSPTPTVAPSPTPTVAPPSPTPTVAPTGTGWFRLPNTKITSYCPPGASCGQVVRAWNSGVMDTLRNRLILWGGGHSNYSGNELYALDLGTRQMSRITEPGKPVVACQEDIAASGGVQPASRHTYDGVAYIAHADTYVSFGGAIFGSGGTSCPIGSRSIWTFDFKTMKWTKRIDKASFEKTEIISVYDPISKLVYIHDNKNLFSYKLETNQLTRITNNSSAVLNSTYSTATLVNDPARNRRWMVMLATRNSVKMVLYYDLNAPGTGFKILATSGDKVIESCYYPGFTYYPKDGSIVSWYGNAPNKVCATDPNSAYKLNLDTGVWKKHTFANGPTAPSRANGVFERFSYSAASNAFVLVFDEEQDAYLLKMDP